MSLPKLACPRYERCHRPIPCGSLLLTMARAACVCVESCVVICLLPNNVRVGSCVISSIILRMITCQSVSEGRLIEQNVIYVAERLRPAKDAISTDAFHAARDVFCHHSPKKNHNHHKYNFCHSYSIPFEHPSSILPTFCGYYFGAFYPLSRISAYEY